MFRAGDIAGGKYRILSRIGGGGLSNVYLVLNESSMKIWAMKETDIQTAKTEIRLLKRLNHPAIPGIIDVIFDNENALIVMDFVPGRTLANLIKEEGPLKRNKLVTFSKNICDVMEYLHRQSRPIIFKDLKPGNIIIGKDGKLYLIDFGSSEDKAGKMNFGTKGYCSPEQERGEVLDGKTDIYSFGMTLYKMATALSPLTDFDINKVKDKSIRKIILKCTRKNKEERPKDFKSVGKMLLGIRRTFGFRIAVEISAAICLLCLSIRVIIGNSIYENVKGSSDYVRRALEVSSSIFGKAREEAFEKTETVAFEISLMRSVPDAVRSIGYIDRNMEANLIELALSVEGSIKKNDSKAEGLFYDIGRMFMFYYRPDDETPEISQRAKASIWWFDAEQRMGSAVSKQAGIYGSIGRFYAEIEYKIIEGDDGEGYKKLYHDIFKLVSETDTIDDNAVLDACDVASETILYYEDDMERSGVGRSEIEKIKEDISNQINRVSDSSKRADERKKIIKKRIEQ